MKTLKRMLAVMLAVVMMMGLGVTSMAATPSADGEITVPVKVEVVGLPSNYTGAATVGVLYDGNVTLSEDDNPTAMDFIDATGLTIGKSTNGDYITSINGLGSIDVEYTSNSYKGYSWMIDMKAGNSVTTQGTKPSWAAVAPEANAWFESPLAATNVAMSGSQYFPYDYSNQSAGGFTTSVEGIYVKYVLTETTW